MERFLFGYSALKGFFITPVYKAMALVNGMGLKRDHEI
jgi:hypothetical protein